MRLFAQEPERALWRELCGSRLGVAFRRQVVLGNRYVADFLAPAVRLAVEVDGGLHARRRAADARRDRDLARLG
jgi:very-short-patch-repair endonuclease